MNGPKYTEEQLHEILRDAAERSTVDAPQYSLSEIQRIAAQADIAPEHVARAVAALPATHAEPSSVLSGEAPSTQLLRRLDRIASHNDILDALTVARQRFGHAGETRDVAGGLEWGYDSGYSSASVSIVPDTDGTVIRLEGRADGRQFMLYVGAAAAVLTGFVATGAATPTFSALSAAVAFIPYATAARFWWNRSVRAAARRLAALADEIAARLDRG